MLGTRVTRAYGQEDAAIVMPRVTALSKILRQLSINMQDLVRQPGQWKIKLPPAAALFNEDRGYTLHRMELRDPSNPMRTAVRSSMTGYPNEVGKRVLKTVKELGLDMAKESRDAGPSVQVPMKRLSRHLKYFDVLVDDAVRVFRPVSHIIASKMQILLDFFHKRSLDNIQRIIREPELMLIGKAPTTGTGWGGVLRDREGFGRHLEANQTVVELGVNQHYNGMKRFFIPDEAHWPDIGGFIPITTFFRHTRRASREDPDPLEYAAAADYSTASLLIDCGAREVGPTPPSAVHGPGLTPSKLLLELRKKLVPPCTKMPNDKEAFAEVMSTPPLTADFIKDGVVKKALYSIDVGFTNQRVNTRAGFLQFSGETVKLGADNIWETGIALRSEQRYDRLTHMLKSGDPGTEISYPILTWIVQNLINEHGLYSVTVYNIGDDWHCVGNVEHLLVLAELLKSFGRTKGMNGRKVFILGRNLYYHDPDTVTCYIMYRMAKSVPSSQQEKAWTPTVGFDAREVEVPVVASQRMGVQDFLSRYKEIICMKTTTRWIKSWITGDAPDSYSNLTYELAQLGGVSEFASQIQRGRDVTEEGDYEE